MAVEIFRAWAVHVIAALLFGFGQFGMLFAGEPLIRQLGALAFAFGSLLVVKAVRSIGDDPIDQNEPTSLRGGARE